ncbi:DUF305 domain-containing protein [Jiangella sp. DSM 45060]|uniref:DUF305 domain-containing protein n=1 Tax=Jiangella sp. DSM 45060 TaxID=1798224 RepID=UPI00087BA6CC|nr:DUF305 domain-containing protein [Jiangella sp. DSM 45060]SDS34363.1 Uncharacterized conserved protein, DUF305 family [Jiangella sp. DSM 45060]
MRRATLGTTTAAAVAALLTLAGCSGDDDTGRGAAPSTSTVTADSRVIQPGRPGETADVIEPGEDIEIVDGGHSETDVRFVEQMIPHHRQAVTMAELAVDRAQDERVLLVADRIIAAQGPEIAVLESWLTERGLPVPAEGAEHDHGLPGMITPLQLEQLGNTSGAEFDELFLTYMSQHHAGAIDMAAAELNTGTNSRVLELAGDVSVEQGIEIDRMREILDSL